MIIYFSYFLSYYYNFLIFFELYNLMIEEKNDFENKKFDNDIIEYEKLLFDGIIYLLIIF